MKKYVVAWILTLALLFSVVGVAGAITDGELDGDGHPFVGLALFYDENDEYMWRCSGTLLSETVFLTAGHCTYSTTKARVLFDADLMELEYPYPDCGQYTCYEGATYVHPEYDDNLFYVRDAGVVVLDETVEGIYTFGVLPEVDQLDDLPMPSGKWEKTWFTSVGYGQQIIFTDEAQWEMQSDRIRMVANPFLKQLNVPGITGEYSLWLSNNHSTGGTCYGDSGGPNFLGKGDDETNIVAGVTSFGMNETCSGSGGVFRMDRSWSLGWVNKFLTGELP